MADQNSTCAGTQELPISQDIIDILGCGTDYYRVLSINKKSFTADELKKSYRKLALKFHPDKNNKPGAKEAFRLVSRAFTILSDPTKKVLYDVNGDDSYSPVSGSDNLVGPYFRRKSKAQQKKWPMMLKASPVIALIVYSIFLGVFTKN